MVDVIKDNNKQGAEKNTSSVKTKSHNTATNDTGKGQNASSTKNNTNVEQNSSTQAEKTMHESEGNNLDKNNNKKVTESKSATGSLNPRSKSSKSRNKSNTSVIKKKTTTPEENNNNNHTVNKKRVLSSSSSSESSATIENKKKERKKKITERRNKADAEVNASSQDPPRLSITSESSSSSSRGKKRKDIKPNKKRKKVVINFTDSDLDNLSYTESEKRRKRTHKHKRKRGRKTFSRGRERKKRKTHSLSGENNNNKTEDLNKLIIVDDAKHLTNLVKKYNLETIVGSITNNAGKLSKKSFGSKFGFCFEEAKLNIVFMRSLNCYKISNTSWMTEESEAPITFNAVIFVNKKIEELSTDYLDNLTLGIVSNQFNRKTDLKFVFNYIITMLVLCWDIQWPFAQLIAFKVVPKIRNIWCNSLLNNLSFGIDQVPFKTSIVNANIFDKTLNRDKTYCIGSRLALALFSAAGAVLPLQVAEAVLGEEVTQEIYSNLEILESELYEKYRVNGGAHAVNKWKQNLVDANVCNIYKVCTNFTTDRYFNSLESENNIDAKSIYIGQHCPCRGGNADISNYLLDIQQCVNGFTILPKRFRFISSKSASTKNRGRPKNLDSTDFYASVQKSGNRDLPGLDLVSSEEEETPAGNKIEQETFIVNNKESNSLKFKKLSFKLDQDPLFMGVGGGDKGKYILLKQQQEASAALSLACGGSLHGHKSSLQRLNPVDAGKSINPVWIYSNYDSWCKDMERGLSEIGSKAVKFFAQVKPEHRMLICGQGVSFTNFKQGTVSAVFNNNFLPLPDSPPIVVKKAKDVMANLIKLTGVRITIEKLLSRELREKCGGMIKSFETVAEDTLSGLVSVSYDKSKLGLSNNKVKVEDFVPIIMLIVRIKEGSVFVHGPSEERQVRDLIFESRPFFPFSKGKPNFRVEIVVCELLESFYNYNINHDDSLPDDTSFTRYYCDEISYLVRKYKLFNNPKGNGKNKNNLNNGDPNSNNRNKNNNKWNKTQVADPSSVNSDKLITIPPNNTTVNKQNNSKVKNKFGRRVGFIKRDVRNELIKKNVSKNILCVWSINSKCNDNNCKFSHDQNSAFCYNTEQNVNNNIKLLNQFLEKRKNKGNNNKNKDTEVKASADTPSEPG